MSNETFQIIITTAVVLAFGAMIVQGLVAVAVYRAVGEVKARLAPALSRVREIVKVEKDTIRSVEILIDKTLLCADILERVAPRLVTLAERTEDVAVRAMRVGGRITELEGSISVVVNSAHSVSLDMHPRLVSVAAEASATVRSVGTQVRRFGRVMYEAIGHARHLSEVIASR